MIGRLTGKIVGKNPEGALVDVGGVGYDVFLPLGTLASLPDKGEMVTLSIHTHVREDDMRLFGFSSERDRTAFRTLLRISGVGPKVALAVLGALSGDQLAQAVGQADSKRLSSIPGIGKKTAERMILELGGKLELGSADAPTTAVGVLGQLSAALKNLGFKAAQVDRVLGVVEKDRSEDDPFEVLLRKALGLLQE